jgi:hypothetical protein
MTQFTKTGHLLLAVSIASMIGVADASDHGGSVYPIGAETVLPGMMPGPWGTILVEFNDFYQANSLAGPTGLNQVPGFHLRVGAVALKVIHNWGVHVLGGELISSLGVPALYEHLNAPFGRAQKSGLGNPDLSVADVAYAKGSWHWWYGLEAYAPGAQYNKNDLLNVGQHNFATAVDGAFTYFPHFGRSELSSKLQYIVNFTNPATQYRSGGEFVWEYAAMQRIAKNLAVGVNGDYYQQLTDDRQNGLLVSDARARSVMIGPEFRYHLGRATLILKYQKETLAENKTSGNAFWLQVGLPLGHRE